MADKRLFQPSSSRPLVNDDLSPSAQFNSWLAIVTSQALMIGTGSPEGVTGAKQLSLYMDDAGIAGAILYIKRDADDGLGDTTKGWILV